MDHLGDSYSSSSDFRHQKAENHDNENAAEQQNHKLFGRHSSTSSYHEHDKIINHKKEEHDLFGGST